MVVISRLMFPVLIMADSNESPLETTSGAKNTAPKTAETKNRLRSSGSAPLSPGPDLQQMAKDAFDKSALYLQGQMEGTIDDYKLLENMNEVTSQRYTDMKQVTQNVAKSLKDLNDKYSNLRPYLEQVDEIDRSSKRLEDAAYAIDGYVKNLEAKYKQLEKRGQSPS